MPLEIPQLDDRNFEQLRAEALARVPVHTPEWTNFNASDPGVTLVELFAFLTDNLLYRSNRIPEANRKKFLSLLGIPLQPATPGRGLVIFSTERGVITDVPVEAGAEALAGRVPFRTRTGLDVLPVSTELFYKEARPDLEPAVKEQFELLYESFLDRDLDRLQFYRPVPVPPPEAGKPPPVVDLDGGASGPLDGALWVALLAPPKADVDAVRAAIADKVLTVGIAPPLESDGSVLRPETWEPTVADDPGLIFELPAVDSADRPAFGPGRYERLRVEYAENVLEAPGVVALRLPGYNGLGLWEFDPEEEGTQNYPPLLEDPKLSARLLTWIKITLAPSAVAVPSGQPRRRPKTKLSWVGANAARIVQAIPVTNEPLGVGTGAPDQSFAVANRPVILDGPDRLQPEGGRMRVEVRNDDGTWDSNWRPTSDLYAAGLDEQVYLLDPEAGRVTFGSGAHGKRPPLGKQIRVSYEHGGGPQGNAAIGAISKLGNVTGVKVCNPLATWGADSGEDVVSGERNISRYLRHRDRAVTVDDFRDIVRRTPGVELGRVEILPLFNPVEFDPAQPGGAWPGAVTALVVPLSDPGQPNAPRPDQTTLEAVCAWLEPRRLVTTEVHVRGPDYVPIMVSAGFVPFPGQVREVVARRVEAALAEYLSPLFGGPPPAPADEGSECDELPGATSAGQPRQIARRGTGWPLGTEVRRQDLEATVTRVEGVRYATGVRLALRTAGGTAADVERVPLVGLQLPVVAVFARPGEPEDPADILGYGGGVSGEPGAPGETGTVVPVPLLPEKC